MHDAKFVYTLTQHNGWAASKSPYLLCGCNKGNGVGNDKHVCKLISDIEQLVLYKQSGQHWLTIKTETDNIKVKKRKGKNIKSGYKIITKGCPTSICTRLYYR